jgi:hypothetical protein
MKNFNELTQEEARAIALSQSLLREAALRFAQSNRQDCVLELYRSARAFDAACRKTGMDEYFKWRSDDSFWSIPDHDLDVKSEAGSQIREF